eukprot:356652-Chlamydomonas_euryale.AAC.1
MVDTVGSPGNGNSRGGRCNDGGDGGGGSFAGSGGSGNGAMAATSLLSRADQQLAALSTLALEAAALHAGLRSGDTCLEPDGRDTLARLRDRAHDADAAVAELSACLAASLGTGLAAQRAADARAAKASTLRATCQAYRHGLGGRTSCGAQVGGTSGTAVAAKSRPGTTPEQRRRAGGGGGRAAAAPGRGRGVRGERADREAAEVLQQAMVSWSSSDAYTRRVPAKPL